MMEFSDFHRFQGNCFKGTPRHSYLSFTVPFPADARENVVDIDGMAGRQNLGQ